MVLTAEEERDGTVLGHSYGVEAVGVAVAWTRRCRRGRENFGSLTTSKSKSSG
jgi:hypothetical protein